MAMSEEKTTKTRLTTSSISTVISISLVLFMIGLLGLIVLYAHKISIYVKENISMSIIMNDEVKEAEIMLLKKTIDASNFVKATYYITKEQAAEGLKKDLGEDFITFLGYNPLLPSIEVKVKADYANNDSLSIIEKKILKNIHVKEVFYQKSLVQKVNENMEKIGIIILGFSFLLIIIAIALINNTIRLSVFSKRFLIRSMQLVGATQGFIRRPFVIKGILHGLIAAGLAIIFIMLTMYFLIQRVPEIVQLQDIDMFLILFAIVILSGIIFSWISTFLAVRKFLKIKTDHLYNY